MTPSGLGRASGSGLHALLLAVLAGTSVRAQAATSQPQPAPAPAVAEDNTSLLPGLVEPAPLDTSATPAPAVLDPAAAAAVEPPAQPASADGQLEPATSGPAARAPAIAAENTPAASPELTKDAAPGPALGLDLLLRLEAFVTQGRTFGVDVSAGRNEGLHGVNYALNLGVAYTLPLPEPWRIVAVSVDVGYTPFIGTGQGSLSQWQARGGVLERGTLVYRYDWFVHMVPLDVGLRLRVPWAVLGLEIPVVVEGELGFASGMAIARSTLTADGAAQPFAQDVGTADFGLGYYMGLGAAYALPPGLGSVTAAYRYSAVRLDFHRPDFNASWGDLGGHHLLLGYRFEF